MNLTSPVSSSIAVLVALFAIVPEALSQSPEAKSDPLQNPFANPVDDESLPRVLIVGDSISIGYTTRVRKHLTGVANVHRPNTNCSWSAFGDENIEEWIGDGKWDVIHFNFGLWDWYGWKQETKATPESYAANLESIVRKLKQTKAKLIFGITTPPCVTSERNANIVVSEERAKEFNTAAVAVMDRNGVQTNDLYSLIIKNREKLQRAENDVHYTDRGRDLLGRRVANVIKVSLANPTNRKKNVVAKYGPSVPKPTESEVRYGTHERHVLDFWKAEADEPTPLVFVIHGGGWKGGSKERADRFVNVADVLSKGISVAAINYRLIGNSPDVNTTPPVKAPLHDAARALQFVRSKAADWNIDKARIGAAGGSAGACSSLWLAFHDDLADAESDDPVARESTRLMCAAVAGAQTTLDPRQMKEWTPNSKYGGHAFGLGAFSNFLEQRDTVVEWINEYSPYHNVTSDDPPVYLIYSVPPGLGKAQKDPTHTSNFGVKLQEHCKATGVDCELVYPDAPDIQHSNTTQYLVDVLLK